MSDHNIIILSSYKFNTEQTNYLIDQLSFNKHRERTTEGRYYW